MNGPQRTAVFHKEFISKLLTCGVRQGMDKRKDLHYAYKQEMERDKICIKPDTVTPDRQLSNLHLCKQPSEIIQFCIQIYKSQQCSDFSCLFCKSVKKFGHLLMGCWIISQTGYFVNIMNHQEKERKWREVMTVKDYIPSDRTKW